MSYSKKVDPDYGKNYKDVEFDAGYDKKQKGVPYDDQTPSNGGSLPLDSSDGVTIQLTKYQPKKRVILIQLVVFVMVSLVCFAPPNTAGGMAAIAKDTSTYIGVLRKCDETSCDPWMSAGASASTTATKRSVDGANAAMTTRLIPRASDPPSDTASASGGGIGSINLQSVFLQTGLATLAAFYMLLFAFIFLLIRYFYAPPLHPDEIPPRDFLPQVWEGTKKFAYRGGRAFVFVVVFILLGVSVAAGMTGSKASIGTGVIVLVVSFTLLIPCALIEFCSAEGAIYGWLTAGGNWFGPGPR